MLKFFAINTKVSMLLPKDQQQKKLPPVSFDCFKRLNKKSIFFKFSKSPMDKNIFGVLGGGAGGVNLATNY